MKRLIAIIFLLFFTSCSSYLYNGKEKIEVTHVLALTSTGDTLKIPIDKIRPNVYYNVIGYDYYRPYRYYNPYYYNNYNYHYNSGGRTYTPPPNNNNKGNDNIKSIDPRPIKKPTPPPEVKSHLGKIGGID